MSSKKLLGFMLVCVSFFTFALSGCSCSPAPEKTEVVVNTGLGMVRTTDKVKNPTSNVLIEVISGGSVAAQGEGELTLDKALTASSAATVTNVRQIKVGDIIRVTADYQYIKLQMLDFPETIIYSPTGEYVFQVPATGTPNWQEAYPTGVFTRSTNTIKASIPNDDEIAEARNLAANPYDYLYNNELNVTTTTDLVENGTLPDSSISVENKEVLAYPHAYANRFTTGNNRGSFLPRNAIDGDLRTGKSHIGYGKQSWGGGRAPTTNTNPGPTGPAWTAANNYGYYDDLTYVVYFGREVILTELGFVMRADDTGAVKHDINFSGMTVEFSDGTEEIFDGFVFSESEQKRQLSSPKKTTSLRLKDFQRNFDTTITAEQAKTAGNWTALSELTAYGSDNNKNVPAVKTTVKNTFGGKNVVYKTNEFNASELKEIVDFAAADARLVSKSRNTSASNPNGVTEGWWIDAVLFSAVMDAYTTTGTLDQYLYMQESFDRFHYLIKEYEARTDGKTQRVKNLADIVEGYTGDGQAVDFADDYLIGETYLLMNDLKPAPHKVFASYANADANMKDKPSWDPLFNTGSNRGNTSDKFDWWWCDAVYMGLNYFTYMSNATGDPQYIEKAYRSYNHWKSILACNDNHKDHGVAGHGEDWALWHRDTGNSGRNGSSAALPMFWARGNAWVFAGIAKQMLYIDENKYPEIYAAYKADLIAMAKTLKYYQREDGSWRASVVDPTHKDGKEATGTSGYVYGLAVGVQLGILPADDYMPVVTNAFNQLLDMRITGHPTIPDGRLGYMQAVGWNAATYPTDGSIATMSNAFGYGLFIHAASAVMRMCQDFQPPLLSVPADAQYGVVRVPEYTGVKD